MDGVSNGGNLIFARCMRFSYCSSVALNDSPGVAGLSLLAVSHACLYASVVQVSLGLPTLPGDGVLHT